jgi:hypothetical protein
VYGSWSLVVVEKIFADDVMCSSLDIDWLTTFPAYHKSNLHFTTAIKKKSYGRQWDKENCSKTSFLIQFIREVLHVKPVRQVIFAGPAPGQASVMNLFLYYWSSIMDSSSLGADSSSFYFIYSWSGTWIYWYLLLHTNALEWFVLSWMWKMSCLYGDRQVYFVPLGWVVQNMIFTNLALNLSWTYCAFTLQTPADDVHGSFLVSSFSKLKSWHAWSDAGDTEN